MASGEAKIKAGGKRFFVGRVVIKMSTAEHTAVMANLDILKESSRHRLVPWRESPHEALVSEIKNFLQLEREQAAHKEVCQALAEKARASGNTSAAECLEAFGRDGGPLTPCKSVAP